MVLELDAYKNMINKDLTRVSMKAIESGDVIGRCMMSEEKGAWTISEWYVNKEYQGKGIGTSLLDGSLKYMYEKFGEPSKIEYIWNGQNEYVMDWLTEHFSPVSKCPLAVQKTQAADDWDSHVYVLDKDSVLNYFGITNTKDAELEF